MTPALSMYSQAESREGAEVAPSYAGHLSDRPETVFDSSAVQAFALISGENWYHYVTSVTFPHTSHSAQNGTYCRI